MMVYFCLSPRHHSSLLPVPLLSLCYNEERLQPELGLGVGEGGGQRFPRRSALHAKSSPSLGRRSWGERPNADEVPQLSPAAGASCPLTVPAGGPVQMVLGDLGRPGLGKGEYPFLSLALPFLAYTPFRAFQGCPHRDKVRNSWLSALGWRHQSRRGQREETPSPWVWRLCWEEVGSLDLWPLSLLLPL